jgi:CCR4-NOT transcriptional regulation complex NOT5 subunit
VFLDFAVSFHHHHQHHVDKLFSFLKKINSPLVPPDPVDDIVTAACLHVELVKRLN